MICFNDINLPYGEWTAVGSLFSAGNSRTSDFPISFINKPSLTVSTNYDNSSWWYSWISQVIWDENSISLIKLMRASTATSNLWFKFSYIAIGRWK